MVALALNRVGRTLVDEDAPADAVVGHLSHPKPHHRFAFTARQCGDNIIRTYGFVERPEAARERQRLIQAGYICGGITERPVRVR